MSTPASAKRFLPRPDVAPLYWHVLRDHDYTVCLYRVAELRDGPAAVRVTPQKSMEHEGIWLGGFEFGQAVSGSRAGIHPGGKQLALAILLEATRPAFALEHYTAFAEDFIAPRGFYRDGTRELQFVVTAAEVLEWAGARLDPLERQTLPCAGPGCGQPVQAPMLCTNKACALAPAGVA